MKRSEAIKIIETVLKSGYDYPASTILQKLEDEGMLPPFNKAGQVPFNTYDTILEAVSEDFKWEEE